LKYGNIKGEVLEFQRAKTARTKRKVEPIRVSLVDDLKEIIKKWGNEKVSDSTYIFPILAEGFTVLVIPKLLAPLMLRIQEGSFSCYRIRLTSN
jgi:hypothetical protein